MNKRKGNRYKIRPLCEETNSGGKETEKRRIFPDFALAFVAVFLIRCALLLAAVTLFPFTARPHRIAAGLRADSVANVWVTLFMKVLNLCVKLGRLNLIM